MAREYRYISGDSHLEIDSKHWVHRIAPEHRNRAPQVIRLPDGSDSWLVEGRPLREVPADLYGGKGRDRWSPIGQNYETTPGTGSPQQRLQEQDQDGIDAEVLFPGVSGPPMWGAIRDHDAYMAVVRGYNDFLAEEYCAVDPDRLIGLGAIPWSGIDDAIAEMERCAKMGFKGVCLGTFPSGRGCPTSEDDRFWAAALDLDMPVTAHQQFDRTGKRAERLLQYPRAPKGFENRVGELSDFCGQMAKFGRLGGVNAIQMALDGVFERFPHLKIFFAETQIGWLPFFLEMCDARYDRHSKWAEEILGWKPLKAWPSEVIREHCYWGFQHDFVGVELRHHIGVDRVIWAVDFPHQDSEWPNSLSLIERQFAEVPPDEKRRMVAENAIEFFHLDAGPT
jgi:predicted TIM-barrel fold metal-dependent hydrolase